MPWRGEVLGGGSLWSILWPQTWGLAWPWPICPIRTGLSDDRTGGQESATTTLEFSPLESVLQLGVVGLSPDGSRTSSRYHSWYFHIMHTCVRPVVDDCKPCPTPQYPEGRHLARSTLFLWWPLRRNQEKLWSQPLESPVRHMRALYLTYVGA